MEPPLTDLEPAFLEVAAVEEVRDAGQVWATLDPSIVPQAEVGAAGGTEDL
jgi:hypothetical protein